MSYFLGHVTLILGSAALLPVLIFLLAVAIHLVIGALLHLVTIHDFDWGKLGNFVENDFATQRGIAILITFVLSISTTAIPSSASWSTIKLAYGPFWLALVGACGAATLPVIRDSCYELIWLITGKNPAPTTVPQSVRMVRRRTLPPGA